MKSHKNPCELFRSLSGTGGAAQRRASDPTYATRSRAIAAAFAITLMLSWRGECWAYIDPNAGGFLSQILAPLAAIFLSFLFYCRNEISRFVKSVRNRLRRIDSREAPDEARK